MSRYDNLEGQRILRSYSLDEDKIGYGSINNNNNKNNNNNMKINNNNNNKSNKVISLPETRESKYLDDDDDNLTDDAKYLDKYNEKLPKTGRQRKKQTTRAKGGEFQAQRKKRRLYFCCVSKEIDIQDLYEHISLAIAHSSTQWKAKLYGDALCISRVVPKRSSLSVEEFGTGGIGSPDIIGNVGNVDHNIDNFDGHSGDIKSLKSTGITNEINLLDLDNTTTNNNNNNNNNNNMNKNTIINDTITPIVSGISGLSVTDDINIPNISSVVSNLDRSAPRFSDAYNQEVFVFEFGAVVFWGFAKGEEKYMLDIVRDFVKNEKIDDNEFEASEDDIAFIISEDTNSLSSRIAVANDVITLPESTTPNQRLAVSFAIAQSSIISIFENRIEKKVEEYKFIPEILSKVGKINLPIRRVGMMIGDIFVIRHDINLHSDVLDTPDFLWEEDIYEADYMIIVKYLEMESRVEVLNTRLDMLKELLDMIQQQMQNAHASKLEWIVIWLIVIEVGIEVVGGGGALLGWWTW